MTENTLTLDKLVQERFRAVAEWRGGTGPAATDYEAEIPAGNSIYLFVVGPEIRYVDSALDGLRHRLKTCPRQQRKGASKRPVHRELSMAIDNGQRVLVYARTIANNERITWNDLPVHLLLGLEAGLINQLNPDRNRRGRTLECDSCAVAGGAGSVRC